jgi:hypothetical protein
MILSHAESALPRLMNQTLASISLNSSEEHPKFRVGFPSFTAHDPDDDMRSQPFQCPSARQQHC